MFESDAEALVLIQTEILQSILVTEEHKCHGFKVYIGILHSAEIQAQELSGLCCV